MRFASLLGFLVLAAGCHSAPPAAPPPAAAPPTPASSTPALPEPIATSAARIRALVAHYDDAALASTFTPDFVADKSADLKRIFSGMGAGVGSCTGERPIEVKSDQEAILEIDCEKAVLKVAIVTEAAAPYRMTGLLIRAKPR